MPTITNYGPPVVIDVTAPPTIVITQVPGVGPPGPTGPAGSGGVTAYTHTQSVPNTVWTIVHSLGFYPNVSAFESTTDEIEGLIHHVDTNSLTVTFSATVSGVAYLS